VSVKIMAMVWDASDLSPTHRLILLSLADHANDDGVCYPSIARLCRRTGLSERAARGAVASLCKAGWLRIDRNAGPRGCNVFTVSTPAGNAPLQEMHPCTKRQSPLQEMHPTPAPRAPKPSGTIKNRQSSRAQAHDAAAPGSDQSQGAAPEAPGAAPDATTRERLLAAMGIGPDGIAGPSRFIGTATDMAEVAKWSGMGLDAVAQAQVIAEACRRQRSADPAWMPRRFSYFTGAMADLAKARAGAVQPSTSTADKVARWRKIARSA
jgi:hypothetical protein